MATSTRHRRCCIGPALLLLLATTSCCLVLQPSRAAAAIPMPSAPKTLTGSEVNEVCGRMSESCTDAGLTLAYLIPCTPCHIIDASLDSPPRPLSESLCPWLPPVRQRELCSSDCHIRPLLHLRFQHPRCPRHRLHEATNSRHHQRNP